MSRSIRLFMFAAPSRFYWLTGKLLPWLWATAALFAIAMLANDDETLRHQLTEFRARQTDAARAMTQDLG